jgi:hypothetical protein
MREYQADAPYLLTKVIVQADLKNELKFFSLFVTINSFTRAVAQTRTIELKQSCGRYRQMLLMRKLGDNEAYKVAIQDDINYYLHDVSTDRFVNMFLDHMK